MPAHAIDVIAIAGSVGRPAVAAAPHARQAVEAFQAATRYSCMIRASLRGAYRAADRTPRRNRSEQGRSGCAARAAPKLLKFPRGKPVLLHDSRAARRDISGPRYTKSPAQAGFSWRPDRRCGLGPKSVWSEARGRFAAQGGPFGSNICFLRWPLTVFETARDSKFSLQIGRR